MNQEVKNKLTDASLKVILKKYKNRQKWSIGKKKSQKKEIIQIIDKVLGVWFLFLNINSNGFITIGFWALFFKSFKNAS